MNINEFTKEVANQFSDCEDFELTPETPFRENDCFDSLTGMSILVMISDNFDYQMSVDDFLKCKTSEDLYRFIINAKK